MVRLLPGSVLLLMLSRKKAHLFRRDIIAARALKSRGAKMLVVFYQRKSCCRSLGYSC